MHSIHTHKTTNYLNLKCKDKTIKNRIKYWWTVMWSEIYEEKLLTTYKSREKA